MDVRCATCGEPWDTYHLRHDEVHETAAGLAILNDRFDAEDEEKRYGHMKLPKGIRFVPQYEGEAWAGTLTPFWREQFADRGWTFGASLYAVLRCPCCRENRELPNAEERRLEHTLVAELLEGDDDGIASTLEFR